MMCTPEGFRKADFSWAGEDRHVNTPDSNIAQMNMDTIAFFISGAARDDAEVRPEVITPDDIERELTRILSGSSFARARRSRLLLRYIVTQMLAGNTAASSEHAIAVEVFARRATDYHPGEDPIVRVQIGRLRQQLVAYYANEGRPNPIRLQIPAGSYTPSAVPACDTGPLAGCIFQPLACLSRDWTAQAFTHGLNDELRHRLHREFGPGRHEANSGKCPPPRTRFLLQGSVRQQGDGLRTSLHVIDRSGSTPAIAWSEQIDHALEWQISSQESLANMCCQVLCRMVRAVAGAC